MSTPFDNRIRRVLNIRLKDSSVYQMEQIPYSDDSRGYNWDYITSSYTRPSSDIRALSDSSSLEELAKKADELTTSYQNDTTGNYKSVASIMNPYSMTRLYGSNGAKYLIDNANTRKYYEIDGDEKGHYAKNPTTSNIIKWGALDSLGRHPYQYQDFVFCKYWNEIPNNRLITLRRFASPTYDNLNFPFDATKGTAPTMHPIATALTYFGEGTNNKLSDLIRFTAGYGWKDEKGDIWELTETAPSMERVEAATGWDKVYSQGIVTMSTLLGLTGASNDRGNPHFDFNAPKSLPNDPYKDGPYSNRVLGPVNKINHTFRRDDEGLKFSMDGLTINFDYMARPIGGINPKAALLDVLSNFLVLGYSSAVWFGGSHRFMINPSRYPFTDDKARQALWEGKLLGEDGAARTLVENFKNEMTNGLNNDNGVGNIFATLADTAKGLLGDLVATCFGSDNKIGQALQGKAPAGTAAGNMKTNIEKMAASSIQARVKQVPFLNNYKAILSGEPVGDWHLVIGNPMNPIVEIGNLICENITITFSDELGPDDFPIGFNAKIVLKHAMGRDRDGIEAMFNKGAGRIYELPDKYYSSADGQTVVDGPTGKKGNGVYDWTSVPKVAAENTYSYKGSMDGLKNLKDAYKAIGTPGFVSNTINMRSTLENMDENDIVHNIMPWQTKIVL